MKKIKLIFATCITLSAFSQVTPPKNTRIVSTNTLMTVTNSGQSFSLTVVSSGSTAFVTPEDFGAVGNGITNDQAALQNAVNYNGGNVIVCGVTGKTYFTATTFTTGDNVRIKNATLTTTNNVSILTIKGKKNVIENCI